MSRLVIAAHADDEVIGVGGLMASVADKGEPVRVGVLTADAEDDDVRRAEAEAAWDVLGVADGEFAGLRCRPLEVTAEAVDAVADWLVRWRPKIVYVPHDEERDPDHAAVQAIARQAMLRVGVVSVLMGYEVWTPMSRYQLAHDVTDMMSRKRSAMDCYRSQTARADWSAGVEGLNRYRGCHSGRGEYVEVLTVMPL